MKNLFIFALGAGAGSLITWKLVEKYYKNLADEEIESVIDTFKNREKELLEKTEKGNKKVEKSETTEKKKRTTKKDKVTNKKIIDTENYGKVDLETAEEQLININPEESAGIEIIHPNDFGEEVGYDMKSWMFWDDGIVTDENDEVVDNPSEYIGDGLSHFGDYEEDSVYVRNKANQTDYEILKTERDFEN